MKKLISNTQLIISISLFSIFLSGCQQAPENVVIKFYRSLESGEISRAKECLSRSIVAKMGDEKLTAALTQESQKISKCGGIKDLKVLLEGKGEIRSGKVTTTFIGTCPEKNDDKITLIQEDGEWKISISK